MWWLQLEGVLVYKLIKKINALMEYAGISSNIMQIFLFVVIFTCHPQVEKKTTFGIEELGHRHITIGCSMLMHGLDSGRPVFYLYIIHLKLLCLSHLRN